MLGAQRISDVARALLGFELGASRPTLRQLDPEEARIWNRRRNAFRKECVSRIMKVRSRVPRASLTSLANGFEELFAKTHVDEEDACIRFVTHLKEMSDDQIVAFVLGEPDNLPASFKIIYR